MTCEFCHDPDCNGVKYWQTDPYVLEIYGETEEIFVCDGMRWARAADI